MYIYSMHFVIDGEENLAAEKALDDAVQAVRDSANTEYVSASTTALSGGNFGRCCKCNCWVSDFAGDEPIRQFSNGAKVDGAWYCDLCLPGDHPNAF